MNDVELTAIRAAKRDAKEFFDNNEGMAFRLEKYAEVTNKREAEYRRLIPLRESGVPIKAEEMADLYYYTHYANTFGCWLADLLLQMCGYERDDNNDWILMKFDEA